MTSARYADHLRKRFPDLAPVVDDLFLLEAHQIANLPQRAPRDLLGIVLLSRPDLVRFLVTRYPPIESFVTTLIDDTGSDDADFVAAAEELAWEIADYIVYQRAPEMYDAKAETSWGRDALVELEPLDQKVVLDGGAGTGFVTFAVAPIVATVFAVEPVGTLRGYMKEKARGEGLSNVYVIDGTLSSIPLPDNSVDALITQRAIGWDLGRELNEIERIVKPGGAALHLLGDSYPAADHATYHQALLEGGYEQLAYRDGETLCRKYLKRV